MIILNLFLVITVLTWKSIPIDGNILFYPLSSPWEVNIKQINLGPCRSPIKVKDVVVLVGVKGCGDVKDCIDEALNGTRVQIEAGKDLYISFSNSSSQCHCTVSSSFSKEDTFMIIQTKDAMTSGFDSDKCKDIEDTDPGGHEVDVTGQDNTNKTTDIRIRRGPADTNNTNNISRNQGPDTNPTGQSKETTKFKWIIMGPICGFIVLVIFSVTILAVHCRRKEKETNRRQTFEDIYFNSTSVRSQASLRK